MHRILCLAVALFALSASGDEGRRPLDASDPQQQATMELFYRTTPCPPKVEGESALCPEALALLRDGGEPLARYLIVQADRSLAEGWDPGSYYRWIGYTETGTGYTYLLERLRVEGPSERVLAGIAASRDPRFIPHLTPLLDDGPPTVLAALYWIGERHPLPPALLDRVAAQPESEGRDAILRQQGRAPRSNEHP